MQDDHGQIDERLVQGLKVLKTQRLMPVVNHTFLVADSTPMFTEHRKELIYLPPALCKFLGIKDKGSMTHGFRREGSFQEIIPYFLILAAILMAGTYPLLLNEMPGTLYERLFLRYLMNAALLVPIVFVETTRKINREMYSLSDALGPRTLTINYVNSLCLTGWNLCFCLSLQHTELSTTLFFSNIMLFWWVINKIFKRASGISEWEVNGSIVFLLGIIIFGFKQWFTDLSEVHVTSLFNYHSILGVAYALGASVCAAIFFISNYELSYYLPSYTSLLIITVFNLGNLEALSLVLSLLYPAQHKFGLLTLSGSSS